MKRILLAILLIASLKAQSQVDWQRNYWNSDFVNFSLHPIFNSVKQTPDGGYVFTGCAWLYQPPYYGNMQIVIVKLDANGVELWRKSYGGWANTGDDAGYRIELTNDNGFVVLASVDSVEGGDISGSHGGKDLLVLKLDENGNLQWKKILGGSSNDATLTNVDTRIIVNGQIKQTSDNGYIIAGSTQSNDGDVSGNHGGYFDGWLVKLDSSGNLLWQKCVGGSQSDQFYDLLVTADGGFLVTGSTSSSDGDVIPQVYLSQYGNSDAWIVKFDASGNLQWQKRYGGTRYDSFTSILPTSDNGYLFGGSTDSNNGDVWGSHDQYNGQPGFYETSDMWVVKTDSNANLTWQRCLGFSRQDFATKILEKPTGGYMVAGAQTAIDELQSGMYSLTDAGDVLGFHYYNNGEWDDAINDFIPTADGKYLLVSSDMGSANTSTKIIKLTPVFDLFLATENPQAATQVNISPNPASHFITIHGNFDNNESITIYDLLGKQMLHEVISPNQKLDVSDFADGVYSIYFDSRKTTLKFVKQ